MKKIFVFILFILCVQGYAQEKHNSFVYNYISSKNGLQHNYVSRVVSDSLNVKWIATENGITKYDGLNFYTIRPGADYPGLENENIETLFIDRNNNLWIGTKSGGLSFLEIETNNLISYNEIFPKNLNNSFRVQSLEQDSNGNIWVGTRYNGIFILNPVQHKIIRNFRTTETRFISKDSEGNIWFCQNSNLRKHDPNTGENTTYRLGETITDIVEDISRNCLWIGFVNRNKEHQIVRFDLDTHSFERIPTNIPSSFTSSLFMDKNNNLWIGTWGSGLYQSNAEMNSFEKMNLVYPPDPKKKNTYEIILDIHEDRNGVIWISSDFGGIVALSENEGFENLDVITKHPVLKNEINVQSIFHDDEEIFLGTIRDGLFYGDSFENLKQQRATSGDIIRVIGKHNNQLLAASQSQVMFFDEQKKIVNQIRIAQPTCFFTQNENMLWVGSQQQGLFKLNTKDGRIRITKNYNTNNPDLKIESMRITSMLRDTQDNIWLGTYNGLHLYDRQTEKFIHHSKLLNESLPSIVNTMFIDGENIWLGTPGGLYKLQYLNKKLKLIKKYNSDNSGLLNDFVEGIISDNEGDLWLTTSTSIIRFDKYNEVFNIYGEKSGVYSSTFNLRSIYFDANKSMVYAGGTDNVTFFNPEDIAVIQEEKDLIFTHLKVNNNKVESMDVINEKTILSEDFTYTKGIELTHLEKSFAIGFTNTRYFKNIDLQYRYKLDGYEDDWNYIGKQHEINFVGLPAGNYTLMVSSSSDSKSWSNPIFMRVKVHYAPWNSPLAFVLYAVIFFAIFGSFVYFIMREIHLKGKLKKEKELSESKFTFFTNISHEFRTPLTLITGPLKELISRKDLHEDVSEKLVLVEKNADRLLNLITQLLDFRKAEHGLLQLDAKNGNIVRFCNEVFLYFQEQAGSKNIEYVFMSKVDEIFMPFDRNKMEIALCNLLSNAIKYTPEGESITVELDQVDKDCVIRIKDTGLGMDKKLKNKIFDRFYQIRTTNTSNMVGTGIGLSFTKKIVELHKGSIEVDSKLEQGTEFTIQIPVNLLKIEEAVSFNSNTIDQYKKLDEADVVDLNVETKENTILVIDDNSDIRNYLKDLLKSEYNILQAKDGVEGIEIATKETPDLILCDIMMPRKDGLTVSKELKSQIKTSHIPIILLTARSSNLFEIEGLKTGADDFVTKPFDPHVIKARITSVLQNRLKTREHFVNKIRFEPIQSTEASSDPESEFINEAVLLVENNLSNEQFDIKVMVDTLNMSQSTLYRKIKSLTGLSLTGFIRSVRLKKAAEIILTTNEKMSTVAIIVGFNDNKYFRESFKKQYGCLPSEYKELKKKKQDV